MNHYFVIRCAYAPDYPLDQNRRRLELTRQFCIPSLAAQTRKDFIVELRINRNDPLLDERIMAFAHTGLVILTQHTCGRHIRSRCDDDDAIAPDFVERVRNGIVGDGWYSFPNGYVLENGMLAQRRYTANQFLTRVSHKGVFELMHSDVKNPIVIDEKPAWIWVRHELNRSPNPFSPQDAIPFPGDNEVFRCVLQ